MITNKDLKQKFGERELNRIIEMAWEDRTTFESIEFQFNITEGQVIEIMRLELKSSSFRLWRERVQGRKTKHQKLRESEVGRFKSSRQRSISNNKISKR